MGLQTRLGFASLDGSRQGVACQWWKERSEIELNRDDGRSCLLKQLSILARRKYDITFNQSFDGSNTRRSSRVETVPGPKLHLAIAAAVASGHGISFPCDHGRFSRPDPFSTGANWLSRPAVQLFEVSHDAGW